MNESEVGQRAVAGRWLACSPPSSVAKMPGGCSARGARIVLERVALQRRGWDFGIRRPCTRAPAGRQSASLGKAVLAEVKLAQLPAVHARPARLPGGREPARAVDVG